MATLVTNNHDNKPRVFAALSFDGGATWRTPVRVDGGRLIGHVAVELTKDGEALVTWLEAVGAQTDMRARRVQPNGRAARTWRVAETSDARPSGFPRLLRVGDEVLYAWTGADGIRVAAQRIKD